MKAHQVAAKAPESFDIAGQPCTECSKPLKAPWGRVDHGKKWVCSLSCQKLYDQRVVIGPNASVT